MSVGDTQETRRLYRSRPERMLAGVCGGLGEYFEIHVAVFRVAFVVLTLLGGAGIPTYVVAALVMPDEDKQDSVVTAALRGRRPWALVLLGLVAVVGAMLLSSTTLPRGDAWLVLLVAAALAVWIARGFARSGPGARLARALGVAVASLAACLLVFAAIVAAAFDVHLHHGFDDRSYTVAHTQDLRREYRLGLGELHLDLSSIRLPAGETRTAARVDIGELRVIVPKDVAVRVRAEAMVGELHVLGRDAEGDDGVKLRVNEAGARVLVLDARVGGGTIRVTRALR